ncbi:MAG: hypothetical protein U5L09_07670 [Bacteroidales bacterium]|nr:hypothetical protein [Bacteroidales bacterium]
MSLPINKILIDEPNERVVWKCKTDGSNTTIKVLDLNTKNLLAARDFNYPIHDIDFDNDKNLIAKSTSSLRKLNADLNTIAINTNIYEGYSLLYIPDRE